MIKQHYPELIPKVATRGAIFARMSPDQKQQLVQELQALGYYVGESDEPPKIDKSKSKNQNREILKEIWKIL